MITLFSHLSFLKLIYRKNQLPLMLLTVINISQLITVDAITIEEAGDVIESEHSINPIIVEESADVDSDVAVVMEDLMLNVEEKKGPEQSVKITVILPEDFLLLAKKKSKNIKDRIGRTLLLKEGAKSACDETIFKNYVDSSLKDCLDKHKRKYQSITPAKRKYHLLDKFFQNHLNGVAMACKLQQVGNKERKKVLDHNVAVDVACISYLIKLLIRSKAIPLDTGKERISFGLLYSFIKSFIIEKIEDKPARKTILKLFRDGFDGIADLIDQYWEDDLVKLKPISRSAINGMEKIGMNILKDGRSSNAELENTLKEMGDNKKIAVEIYVELENLLLMLFNFQWSLTSYIAGVAKLDLINSSENERIGPNTISKAWQDINGHIFLLLEIIQYLYCFAVGHGNIDAFLDELKVASEKAAAEDTAIKASASRSLDIGDALREMFFESQPSGKDFAEIRLITDNKEEGCQVVLTGEPPNMPSSEIVEDVENSSDYKDLEESSTRESSSQTPEEPVPTSPKDPATIPSTVNSTSSPWASWGFLFSITIVMFVFVFGYIYLEFF